MISGKKVVLVRNVTYLDFDWAFTVGFTIERLRQSAQEFRIYVF